VIKWIVVGVDGSDCSRAALGMALEIAQKFNAHMRLVFVIAPLPLPPEGAVAEAAIIENTRSQGEELLDAAKKQCVAAGVQVETSLAFGGPADSIAERAMADDADLVVVGSHGRGAVARLVLGSVADRLSHILQRPLLIVRSSPTSKGEQR